MDFGIRSLPLEEFAIDDGHNIAGVRADGFLPARRGEGCLKGDVMIAAEGIAILL